jgi:protein O-GlcNAc transferase
MEAQEAQAALQNAIAALSSGNMVIADFIAQDVLAQIPDHPLALNLIGVIAGQIGLHDKASACFRRALEAQPNFSLARANLQKSLTSPPPRVPEGERFLLIKEWGFGFWADVSHVLGGLLLAEISGRTPVIHWGGGSLFSDRPGRDAFRFYFRAISDLDVYALPKFAADDIFPRKWSAVPLASSDRKRLAAQGPAGLHLLNRPERLAVADFYIGAAELAPWIPQTHAMHGRSVDAVYRYLIARYLKPGDEITTAVDAFAGEHFTGKATIAVHVRGTDKSTEFVGLAEFNTRYFELIDAHEPPRQIFLLTDDARIVDVFRARYGERVVATESQRSQRDDLGPHHTHGSDRVLLGREVMTDVYLALRCDSFIGNGRSNVSAMIALLKDWPASDCTLLAPSQLLTPNTFLHGLRPERRHDMASGGGGFSRP